MADVVLSTTNVELRTCKLTKTVLKQLPICHEYGSLRALISSSIRSPSEDARLKEIEAKYSTPEGATEEERKEAEELSKRRSFYQFLKDFTLGWIHGSVMGDEYSRYLLVQVEPGQYALYANPHMETLKKFKQIFVV